MALRTKKRKKQQKSVTFDLFIARKVQKSAVNVFYVQMVSIKMRTEAPAAICGQRNGLPVYPYQGEPEI